MIHLSNVHKSFGSAAVLQGVTLDIEQGQSLVLIGASGSGKSVLLKCILGLETPDSGTITVDGKPANPPQFLDRFGMLFQGAALFDSLPVWENVAFRALQTGQERPMAKKRAIEKLDRVGLSAKVADQFPSDLSGGMRKRAGLARAIFSDPDIIFFDEPTTGLDPIRANTINTLIRGVVDEIGATTLTITHDLTSVDAIADKVAMLKDGKIIWQGVPDELRASSNPDVDAFVTGRAAP
ncbi:phospholipid/cholesterol/gamma-HCH transport system ATP-binding protein [Cognatiyoonia sediminum]|uniref:Phospholipid/cholesterol/gamma-HCH transport system ATP-binding protein n=1 Tax=Cognatiyoonia sediminum TaxID=1508389 RepID=A0A1M5LH57_9RHOB|nr:ATP-binding cassette domain-containing protein [Cognatiyoonia sediminum]SHG64381.1 phospholipid/cholesterol/gamma-HCH transport system ATP-binding protein [Cognatiyoonia sediminum]